MINEFAGQNMFDSCNIEERINELTTELENETETESSDDQTELSELIEFRDDVSSTDWEDCIVFINEDYFENYARELAEDIGAISRDADWPTSCIDWGRAAQEVQIDYTSVEFGNTTYYYQ